MPLEATRFHSLPDGPVRDALLRAVTWVFDRIFLVGVPIFVLTTVLILTTVKIISIETDKATPRLALPRGLRLSGSAT